MKIKIALISESPETAKSIKEAFRGITIYSARNILEYYSLHSGKSIEAIIFSSLPFPENEFKKVLGYIRSKAATNKTPVAILFKEHQPLSFVISDRMVRLFSQESGVFLALMDFFGNTSKPASFEEWLDPNKLEEGFIKAIANKLGQNTTFLSRAANSDETHESFISQKSDEVSSNLLWFKFSIRILNQGSEELIKSFDQMSEEEIQEACEHILAMILEDFKRELMSQLKQAGAVLFVPSSELSPQEKNPYIREATSTFQLFESSTCTLLLEIIRYL